MTWIIDIHKPTLVRRWPLRKWSVPVTASDSTGIERVQNLGSAYVSAKLVDRMIEVQP